MAPSPPDGIFRKPFKLFLTERIVSEDQNTRETAWLRQEPEKLLAHYQFIIEATAARFISRGFFRPEEKMELVQEVNVELLERKLAKMQEQFNGSVYLRTYFSKVVYNCCLETARRRQRQPQVFSAEHLREEAARQRSAFEDLAIRDEFRRLEALLRGHRQSYKLRLCFKLWCRCPVRKADWQFFDGPKTRDAVARLQERGNRPDLAEKESFELANGLFNLLEGKNSEADSLRRWVQQQADYFVDRLNGNPPLSSYNRDTFKTLLRFYFDAEEAPEG